MLNENTVKYKSKRFAVRVLNLYKHLTNEKKEFVLSKQILRSETLYWLDLLFETEYLDKKEYFSLKNDCDEIKRMLSSTTKTMND